MKDYKVVSRHDEDLADGRIGHPGEIVQLTAEQEKEDHNKRLIEDGLIIEAAKKKPTKTDKANTDKRGDNS